MDLVKNFLVLTVLGLIATIGPADGLSATDTPSREESADHQHVYRVYAGGCSRSIRLQKVFADLDQACNFYGEIRTKFLRHRICSETVEKQEGLGYWTEPKRYLIYVKADQRWQKAAEVSESKSLSTVSVVLTRGESGFVVIRDLLE